MRAFIWAILIGLIFATTVQAQQSNAVVGSNSPAPYIGAAATRGRVAFSNLGANSGIMAQTMHWARDTMVNPTFVEGNFYVTASTEVTTGTGTIGDSICVGNFTTCNNGSNYTLCGTARTITFPVGITTITCSGVVIPRNSQFYRRSLQTNASGAVYAQVSSSQVPALSAPDCWATGNLSVTDMLTSGTYASNQCGSYDFYPLAVVAQTTQPTVALLGDSRIECAADYPTDATADCGDEARSIGPVFGYSTLGIGGALGSAYLSGTRTYRDKLIKTYFSHFIDEFCINDIAGGATAAAAATTRASIAALYTPSGLIGIGTTLEIETNSTDNWTTTANQSGTNAAVLSFNQLVRQGIAGESFYYDIAYAMDPSHQGLWPVAANPYLTALTPVFSGTGSISAANPAILTITACTTCTLPIGTNLAVSGNVLPGTFVSGYGSGVSGTGVCTATCTYTATPTQPSAVTSQAITAAGFFTVDGIHNTPNGANYLKATGAVNTDYIRR